MEERKLKTLPELFDEELANAKAEAKAKANFITAYQIGRLCNFIGLHIIDGQNAILPSAYLTRIEGRPTRVLTISLILKDGSLSPIDLPHEQVINIILSHYTDLYREFYDMRENGEIPQLLEFPKITLPQVDEDKIFEIAVSKYYDQEEEFVMLPSLRGSKRLLEGRNKIGSHYESRKWEAPQNESHITPKDYKINNRKARREKRRRLALAL